MATSSRGRAETQLQTSRNNKSSRRTRMHTQRQGRITAPSSLRNPTIHLSFPTLLSPCLFLITSLLEIVECLTGSPVERGGETLHTSHLQCHFSIPSFCSTLLSLLCALPLHILPPASSVLRPQHPPLSFRVRGGKIGELTAVFPLQSSPMPLQ